MPILVSFCPSPSNMPMAMTSPTSEEESRSGAILNSTMLEARPHPDQRCPTRPFGVLPRRSVRQQRVRGLVVVPLGPFSVSCGPLGPPPRLAPAPPWPAVGRLHHLPAALDEPVEPSRSSAMAAADFSGYTAFRATLTLPMAALAFLLRVPGLGRLTRSSGGQSLHRVPAKLDPPQSGSCSATEDQGHGDRQVGHGNLEFTNEPIPAGEGLVDRLIGNILMLRMGDLAPSLLEAARPASSLTEVACLGLGTLAVAVGLAPAAGPWSWFRATTSANFVELGQALTAACVEIFCVPVIFTVQYVSLPAMNPFFLSFGGRFLAPRCPRGACEYGS